METIIFSSCLFIFVIDVAKNWMGWYDWKLKQNMRSLSTNTEIFLASMSISIRFLLSLGFSVLVCTAPLFLFLPEYTILPRWGFWVSIGWLILNFISPFFVVLSLKNVLSMIFTMFFARPAGYYVVWVILN